MAGTSSVSASWELKLDVTDTLDVDLDLTSSDPRVLHSISGSSGTLTASTTPPATKVSSDTRALSAGADAIDLTAAPGRDGGTVAMTGLKVQLVKIACPSTNTAGVKFAPGASNGYALFGHAAGEVTVLPGCEMCFYWADQLADVAVGAKAIDVSSTDLDAAYSIIIVAG